jgi:cyclic pyranopterin monophosphate synthase
LLAGVPRPPHGYFEAMSELSHLDEAGELRMVDVGDKPVSRRRASAHATLRMAPETAARLSELPKGDAIAAAKLAGIMAAKRTSELIPLCHPLPLTHVEVRIEEATDVVGILASVETTAQTGVEMEALVAATIAALTIYDMAKAIDSSMELSEVRLVEKTKEPLE